MRQSVVCRPCLKVTHKNLLSVRLLNHGQEKPDFFTGLSRGPLLDNYRFATLFWLWKLFFRLRRFQPSAPLPRWCISVLPGRDHTSVHICQLEVGLVAAGAPYHILWVLARAFDHLRDARAAYVVVTTATHKDVIKVSKADWTTKPVQVWFFFAVVIRTENLALFDRGGHSYLVTILGTFDLRRVKVQVRFSEVVGLLKSEISYLLKKLTFSCY